ncbi:MAG: hypothetical protein JNK82_14540 [Myxococcaceae bacterium]|nr:hypothetical protein [Myxococcaceae bacterium]
MTRAKTGRAKKPAAAQVRRPSEELAELIGPESRTLEALVDEVFELDLMQVSDALRASALFERFDALSYPFEPDDRAAISEIVRDASKPVARETSKPAPPAKVWLAGSAEHVEILCPGLTHLLVEAAQLAGAKEPGPFIRGLKQLSLGELCDAGDELVSAMDNVRKNREHAIDVTVKLKLALRMVRVPHTPAQIKDLAAEYRRRGPELARRFRSEDF